MNILDAMDDGALFRPWFGPEQSTWAAWRVFIASAFGLPIAEADMPLFTRCTGRTAPQTAAALESWMIVGRRGGKSRVAALLGLFLATFRDHRPYLAPGEIGMLPIIASGRKQARTIARYIIGMVNAVPMLRALLATEPTKETIAFSTGVEIEILTADFRSVRNYTMVSAIVDEIAFLRTDEESASPDSEILNALRPCMGTIPGSMLIALSTPYARAGTLFESHRDHFGRNGDEVFVWQADTETMHPHSPESRLGRLIAKAYEKDAAAASAEYGAAFRSDLESFVSREAVERCVAVGRVELPPVLGTHAYRAFVDPSGGSVDSMTLGIAHYEAARARRQSASGTGASAQGRAVLDVIRERRAPFNPSDVVAEFAGVLRAYGTASVRGDRYGGGWPAERFREHGIYYEPAGKTKSEIYAELLPMLNSGGAEILDNRRLVGQLLNLERRVSRGGRDSIDHGPGAHDDVINAAAGALLACRRPRVGGMSKALWG